MLRPDGWDVKRAEAFTPTLDPRSKWNQKFKARDGHLLSPEKFFLRHEHLLKPGSLLDLACGDGRNAIYFAERGFDVTGLDFSEVALERLRGFALGRNLSVTCIEADLTYELNLRTYEKVILSHFKPEAALVKTLPTLLNPGGTLAICTFNTTESMRNGFSVNYCLASHELSQIDGLEVLVYDSFEESSYGETRYLDGYIFRKK